MVTGEGIWEAEQIPSRNTDKVTPGRAEPQKAETTQRQPETKDRRGNVRSRGIERDAPHGVGPLVGQQLSNAGDSAHLASVPPRGAHPGEQTPCVVDRYLCSAALVTVARGWEPPSIPQPRSTRTAALSLGHEGKKGSTNTGCKVEEP